MSFFSLSLLTHMLTSFLAAKNGSIRFLSVVDLHSTEPKFKLSKEIALKNKAHII